MSRASSLPWTNNVDILRASELNELDVNQAAAADPSAAISISGGPTFQGDLALTGDIEYSGSRETFNVDLSVAHIMDGDWQINENGIPKQTAVTGIAGATNPVITFCTALPDGCEWTGVRLHVDPIGANNAPPSGDRFQLTSAGYIDLTTGTEVSTSGVSSDPNSSGAAYRAQHSFDVTWAGVTWDASKHIARIEVGGEVGPSGNANMAITQIEALITPSKYSKRA